MVSCPLADLSNVPFVLADLSESDLPYTRGLMNYGVDSYTGKTVLILGGGDGALLHELLKEDPEHVLMIDVSVRGRCMNAKMSS